MFYGEMSSPIRFISPKGTLNPTHIEKIRVYGLRYNQHMEKLKQQIEEKNARKD